MTYKEIQRELIIATKERNKHWKAALVEIISTAKNMAIAQKCKDDISESIVTDAVMKTVKMYKEQVETCPSDREELLAEYNTRLKYAMLYMPVMMNEEEVKKAVYHILATVDIQRDTKGALMKAVMPRLKGKADGKLINKVVTEIYNKTIQY